MLVDHGPAPSPARLGISVVLTTYRRVGRLPELLEALLAQEGLDELVVVDDASSDGTAELLTSWAGRDGRLVPLLLPHNLGQPRARHCGVQAASRPYVLSVDDDVALAPGTVAGHLQALTSHPTGTVVVGYMPVAPDCQVAAVAAQEYGAHYEAVCRRYEQDSSRVLSELWAGNFSFAASDYLRAVDRDKLRVGYGEDRDLGLRLEAAGCTGVFDRTLAAEHRYQRSFEASLRDAYAAGRGARELQREHPDNAALRAWVDESPAVPPVKHRVCSLLAQPAVWPLARALLVRAVAAAETAGRRPLAQRAARLGWLVERGRGSQSWGLRPSAGDEVSRPRLFVMVERHVDAVAYAGEHAVGRARDASPYGLAALAERGWHVTWSRPHPAISHPSRVVRKLLGVDVAHAVRQRAAVRAADALYAHEDHDALALCLAAILAGNTAALSPNVIWVATRWPQWAPWRRALVRRLLGAAPQLLVNSTTNVDALARLGLPKTRYVRFGVAAHAPLDEAPGPAPDLLIVGNDEGRDWSLLRRVLEGEPARSVVVASGRPPQVPLGGHVDVRSIADPRELAWFYGHAGACLIPLQHNEHASGVTVLLEALAAGGRVVVSDTGGLRDYASDERVRFVDVGDAAGFDEATTALVADSRTPRGQGLDASLTRQAFLDRLDGALRRVLA